jgi:hypothetical protein
MSDKCRYDFRPLGVLDPKEQQFYVRILKNAKNNLFACFTFRHSVSSEQARRALDNFLRLLSSRWRYGENIGCIWAQETTLSGLSNFEVHRHIHCVLFSNAPLSAEGIQKHWSSSYGNAKVELYDFSQAGISYILKMRDREHCEWGIENLHFFAQDYEPKNKSARQALRRHRNRAEFLHGSNPRVFYKPDDS